MEYLRYIDRENRTHTELMTGKRFRRPVDLDLTSGTLVTLTGYDGETAWPLVEWVDGQGSVRVTTIDPVIFAEYFVPVLQESDLKPWGLDAIQD